MRIDFVGGVPSIGAKINGVGEKAHGLVEWKEGFLVLDSDRCCLVWVEGLRDGEPSDVKAKVTVLWQVRLELWARERCRIGSSQLSIAHLPTHKTPILLSPIDRPNPTPLLRASQTRASSSRAWRWLTKLLTLESQSSQPGGSGVDLFDSGSSRSCLEQGLSSLHEGSR